MTQSRFVCTSDRFIKELGVGGESGRIDLTKAGTLLQAGLGIRKRVCRAEGTQQLDYHPFTSVASAVCAVVVTYNPEIDLLSNLRALRSQVNAVVLVDNGSGMASLPLFDQARDRLRCAILRNEANLGIAAALNKGVQWALAHGHRWVALFDQDSTVTEGYIDKMLSEYNNHPERERIGMVAPQYQDRKTGTCSKPLHLAADGAPLEVMTSGSLIPAAVLQISGNFREDFFIDQVDHEFSFRLRDLGYKVALCSQALLIHAPGHPERHSFLGVLTFHTTHHSAGRRYYMTRNSLVMVQQYWYKYPAWAWYTCKSLLVSIPIRIVLAEEKRWDKLKHIVRGVADALLRRSGKRVDL